MIINFIISLIYNSVCIVNELYCAVRIRAKKQFFLKLNFSNASNADVYPGIFYGDVIIPAPTTTRRGGGGVAGVNETGKQEVMI